MAPCAAPRPHHRRAPVPRQLQLLPPLGSTLPSGFSQQPVALPGQYIYFFFSIKSCWCNSPAYSSVTEGSGVKAAQPQRCSAPEVSGFQVPHRHQTELFRPEAGFQGDSVIRPRFSFTIAPAAEEGVGVKVPELNEFHEDKKTQQRPILL